MNKFWRKQGWKESTQQDIGYYHTMVMSTKTGSQTGEIYYARHITRIPQTRTTRDLGEQYHNMEKSDWLRNYRVRSRIEKNGDCLPGVQPILGARTAEDKTRQFSRLSLTENWWSKFLTQQRFNASPNNWNKFTL